MMYLKTVAFYVGLSFGLLCANVYAANMTLRSQISSMQASNSVLFPANNNQNYFLALDTTVETKGLRFSATAWRAQNRDSIDSQIKLSELVYDFSLADWQLSIGKKKLDWDVGYGFRPLDMFSPTAPLALNTAVSPGAWMVTGDWFTSDGTLTLICNESQPTFTEQQVLTKSGVGCGARYYQYFDQWEVQSLVHYDSQVKTRIGFSALSVLTNNLEFHSSLLWQQQYRTSVFQASALTNTHFVNPVTVETKHNALQLLGGLNYSTDHGVNFILEYWYDGRSPSAAQWQAVIQAAKTQHQQINQQPLARYQLQAEQQMFSSQNLFQQNLMLNVMAKRGALTPKLMMLLNPEDKGLLLNLRLCYDFNAGHSIELGARFYTGPANSVYRQLDYDTIYYLNINIVL